MTFTLRRREEETAADDAAIAVAGVPGHAPPPARSLPARALRALLAAGAMTLLVTLVIGLVNGGSAGDARVLVVDEDGAVSLVDTATGVTTYTVADALVAPDRSRLFRTSPVSGDTLVEELDAGTGEVTASRVVGGDLEIRAVSPRGGAIALLPTRHRTSSIYEPEPRESTAITVVRSQTGGSHTYYLTGNFEPETFSTAEDTLFLIEYWPPTEPDRYFVRQLDLETRVVRDVYSPEVELQPEMRGTARSQVISPDGDFLYTLYTIGPDAEPVHDHHASGGEMDRWGFVHALSLEEEWSHCIFLPVPFGTTDGDGYGLGISPDGDTLYAVDATTNLVARIDARDQHVTKSAEVVEIEAGGGPLQVAVGLDDTLYVASNATVIEVQPSLVAEAGWGGGDKRIRALDVSPDGRQLRVAVANEVMILDLASRVEVATITVPGSVAFFGPPTGTTLEEFSLVCAC